MHLGYWKLKKSPFNDAADTSFFYLFESHKEALNLLLYPSKMMKDHTGRRNRMFKNTIDELVQG